MCCPKSSIFQHNIEKCCDYNPSVNENCCSISPWDCGEDVCLTNNLDTCCKKPFIFEPNVVQCCDHNPSDPNCCAKDEYKCKDECSPDHCDVNSGCFDLDKCCASEKGFVDNTTVCCDKNKDDQRCPWIPDPCMDPKSEACCKKHPSSLACYCNPVINLSQPNKYCKCH
jgi:hypothetical protein